MDRGRTKKAALAGLDSVYDKTLPWKAKPEVGFRSLNAIFFTVIL